MIKQWQSYIPFLLILILLNITKSGFAGTNPTADFNVDNTTPVVGESIEFSDNSTNGTILGATDPINTWNWDFGSGAIHSVTGNNQATGQGPHNVYYSTSGLKTVSLEVVSAGNRNDTETKNNYINVGLAPTSGSIGTNQTICLGDTPNEFTSEADGGGSVNTSIVYEWETDASGVWATIPGETGSTYQPPPLSITTSYRRRTETDWGGSIRYSGYTNEVLITVNPLPTAPTAGNINITYDGTLHTGTATPPSGSSVIWYDAATGGSVTTAPSRTDVGTSSAWAESEVDATGCKSTTRTEVTVTVTKKDLQATAVANDITYGDPAPTVMVQYNGFVSGDDASVLDDTGFTLGTDYTQGDVVGTYNTTIAIGSANDNNYNLTPLNTSTFNVGQRAITITADAKSKTYGTADPVLTYQITSGSIYGGDTPTGTLNRIAGEDVGTYAIQQNTLTYGSNYNETYIGADLTIGQKLLTPNIVAENKCYDGTTDVVLNSQTLTGVETGDDVSLLVASANFVNAGPGTAIIVNATGLSLGGSDAGNYSVPTTASASADIYDLPSPPTTTDGQICIGSTTSLLASGAVSGEVYKWYSASTGGTLLKTSTDHNDNSYTTPTISSTTNYWVSIESSDGCESSRTQVTAVFPTPPSDDQTTAGTDKWIGHIYDGINFNTYYGYYEPGGETFNEGFGGNQNCFDISSSLGNRSIYTETMSVRYRMTTSRTGCYLVNLRSDDGIRLSVDGSLIFSRWVAQAPSIYSDVLLPLDAGNELILEYYENGGQNVAEFYNLHEISNTLTTNTTQEECNNETFAQISGTVSPVPAGITLSDWQWYYSTSPTGAGTPISGATSENYTPSGAPFNTPDTYYVYRTVNVNSSNANNENNWGATSPVVCTLESDRAEIVVNGISATVSLLSANNECPELREDQGFNPENGNYDAGSTLVSFRVTVDQTPISDWNFTYTLSGASLRTGLASPPVTPYNTNLTDNITVPSGTSSIDLHFYVNNNPPVEVIPEISITNISNATCIDTGSDSHTTNVTINAMPDVGQYH